MANMITIYSSPIFKSMSLFKQFEINNEDS